MVMGVFCWHEIANSSPRGQDQPSSVLSRQVLFIALLGPPCGDGVQQSPRISCAVNAQLGSTSCKESVHRLGCYYDAEIV